MPTPLKNHEHFSWIKGELKLAGSIDSRLISLLRAIEKSGSINQAAKQAGLSYKGAWQMLERANNLAPKILVNTAVGGSNGGGTSLTSSGKLLLDLFTEIDSKHKEFLKNINNELICDSEMQLLFKRLIIQTSATNQLFGIVKNIIYGTINLEILVELKSGQEIVSTISIEACNTLELSIGSNVVLLINYPEITLVTDRINNVFSARNCLSGKIVRIQKDSVNVAVVIQLPSGDTLVSQIRETVYDLLNLKLGDSVSVAFKSNAVIIGSIN
jgi:molybdate transport system regulatory protein